MKKEATIQAQQLKKGDIFRIPGKRLFHEVNRVIKLDGEGIIPEHKGKLLVLIGCKQMIFSPEFILELQEN